VRPVPDGGIRWIQENIAGSFGGDGFAHIGAPGTLQQGNHRVEGVGMGGHFPVVLPPVMPHTHEYDVFHGLMHRVTG